MPNNYDIVIRNGTIYDGTGDGPLSADLAIQDGTIAAIGKISRAGREEIDARGRIVTPGFVDIHTHFDGQITWSDRLTPSSHHGVTTVVMGNCGVGFAPVRPGDQSMLIKLMEGVEDIPEVVMAEGIPWNWETFPDYLDALDKRHADVDFAAQLPHSALRVYVMGERGTDREPPTQEDLAAMRRLTAEAVRAGAIGVSTSRALAHRFRSGELAPSLNSEKDELLSLALGLRDAGGGVFQLVPNTRLPVDTEYPLFETIVRTSGRPLSFSLLQIGGRDDYFACLVDRLAASARKGEPIRGQFYPRPIGVLMGLDLSYHPFSLNPGFAPLADLPLAQKVAAMRDPQVRAQLLAEHPRDPNPFFLEIVQRTDNLFKLGDPPDYHPQREKSIRARAEAAGISTLQLIYDTLLEDDGHAILYAPSTDVQDNLEMVRRTLGAPGTIIGLGDGGAHYGMICDAAYPTYLLTKWVRDGGDNAFGLAAAVQALTRTPALAVGMHDRGLLARGFKADVNILDLDRLHLHAPSVERDLPAGGKRLQQRADGYDASIVSGVVTYRHGEPTGALPGRLVRSKNMQAMPSAAL